MEYIRSGSEFAEQIRERIRRLGAYGISGFEAGEESEEGPVLFERAEEIAESMPRVRVCYLASDGQVEIWMHESSAYRGLDLLTASMQIYESETGRLMKRHLTPDAKTPKISHEDFKRLLTPREAHTLHEALNEDLNPDLRLLRLMELSPADERKVQRNRNNAATYPGKRMGEMTFHIAGNSR